MLPIGDLLQGSSLHPGQGRERKPLHVASLHRRGTCAQLMVVWFPVHRSYVRAVVVLRCRRLELELLADPRPLGFPLPDAGKHPLLAAHGLPLRPRLSAGHPRLSDPAAVRAGGRYNSEWQRAAPHRWGWLRDLPSPSPQAARMVPVTELRIGLCCCGHGQQGYVQFWRAASVSPAT